jgi:hypothetical protein
MGDRNDRQPQAILSPLSGLAIQLRLAILPTAAAVGRILPALTGLNASPLRAFTGARIEKRP